MSETPKIDGPNEETPAAAAPANATATKEQPAPARVDQLPPFNVLLHNDQHNDMVYVVEAIVDLTPLNLRRATDVMFEAHRKGTALLLTTHRERAELYVDQFLTKNLTVTIEPA